MSETNETPVIVCGGETGRCVVYGYADEYPEVGVPCTLRRARTPPVSATSAASPTAPSCLHRQKSTPFLRVPLTHLRGVMVTERQLELLTELLRRMADREELSPDFGLLVESLDLEHQHVTCATASLIRALRALYERHAR